MDLERAWELLEEGGVPESSMQDLTNYAGYNEDVLNFLAQEYDVDLSDAEND